MLMRNFVIVNYKSLGGVFMKNKNGEIATRKECFAYCNFYRNHCCVLSDGVDCTKCRFFKTKEEISRLENKN